MKVYAPKTRDELMIFKRVSNLLKYFYFAIQIDFVLLLLMTIKYPTPQLSPRILYSRNETF